MGFLSVFFACYLNKYRQGFKASSGWFIKGIFISFQSCFAVEVHHQQQFIFIVLPSLLFLLLLCRRTLLICTLLQYFEILWCDSLHITVFLLCLGFDWISLQSFQMLSYAALSCSQTLLPHPWLCVLSVPLYKLLYKIATKILVQNYCTALQENVIVPVTLYPTVHHPLY